MEFSSNKLEDQLLETAAGRAVFDSLVQANVNLRTVSVERVKQMLLEECRFLRHSDQYESADLLFAC